MSDEPAPTAPDPNATPSELSTPHTSPHVQPYPPPKECKVLGVEAEERRAYGPPLAAPRRLGLPRGLQACDEAASTPSASSTAAADIRELEGHAPMPLDFTVYRQTTRRLTDCTEVLNEPTGISVPNAVRNAILEHAGLKSIHVYDGPYACGPIYGFGPLPANAFYVHYQDLSDLWFVGRGKVMIFSHTGAKLYDGPDGGE